MGKNRRVGACAKRLPRPSAFPPSPRRAVAGIDRARKGDVRQGIGRGKQGIPLRVRQKELIIPTALYLLLSAGPARPARHALIVDRLVHWLLHPPRMLIVRNVLADHTRLVHDGRKGHLELYCCS